VSFLAGRLAEKQLRKLPRHIVDNLLIWVAAVEHDGLECPFRSS